jgi:hypothetical protein
VCSRRVDRSAIAAPESSLLLAQRTLPSPTNSLFSLNSPYAACNVSLKGQEEHRSFLGQECKLL